MPEFTLTVQGLDSLQEQLSELPDNLNEAVTRGLEEAASEAVNQIQEEISTAFPPPSIPGEAPHVRTGSLRRSVRITDVGDMRVTISIGGADTFAPYASYLEFGTSKMQPRPFVDPILQRILPEVGTIVLEAVNAATVETVK